MPKKLTFQEFLDKAHEVQGNRYAYDHVKYVNTTTKVAVTCPKHGDFMVTPKNLFKGKGCPICAGNKPNTTKSFIEKARKVHGDKYDYSKVHFTRNREKVCIICPKHGEFWQEANSHLRGHGCPKCYAEKITGVKHPERYQKAEATFMKKYGVSNPMKLERIREKTYQTKRKNGTFNTSDQEEKLYRMLVGYFGKRDVKRQYVSPLRYPSHCDFYIPSRDMFIELNASWTHNNHWFRKDDHDKAIIAEWQSKHTAYYDRAIKSWTSYDVIKRKWAKKHHLNYVVFWDQYLLDARMWLAMGAPDGHDATVEYSWLPEINAVPSSRHFSKLSPRTYTQIVHQKQFYVFYKHELAMWRNPKTLYKEFPLKGFLFMNRFKYLKRLPQDLTFHQLLSAFAISGIYRGYSSFDASLMQKVIDDYLIHSVYDPFAGWGERYLCSVANGIAYQGVDINADLLDGYQLLMKQSDSFDNESLSIDDSRKVIPAENTDAVITCPPYFNIERYSESGIENNGYSGFLADWKKIVGNCQNVKYFCFQINQRYKKDMAAIVKNCGFKFITSYAYRTNRASNLQRKNGKNTKREFEEMLVFRNINL